MAGLGFFPEYRSPKQVQQQRDAEYIKATGQHLASVARHTLEQRPPALDTARHSLENLAELGDQLAVQPLSRSEALRELTSAADKLRQDLKSAATDPAVKRLQQLARSRPETGPTASAEELQKRIQELEKAVGDQPGKAEKLARLQEKLAAARKAATGLQAKDNAGAAAREHLSQALSALSREAGELGLSLKGLEEAMAALAGDKPGQAMTGLDAAFQNLEQLREMAQTLRQLRQQAAQLGKDLAEQLKNGQITAAQQTLQRMTQQLQSGQISPEQLEKVLREVADAVRPAQDYGKAGESLNHAAQQMRTGDKSGAATSLARAAKELDNLLDQLADAESLAQAMEALQRAQMAIATGRGLGAGRNLAAGWDTWTGGQPGEGIGSGTNPNDVFGEGDPALPPNLAPAKIRGEITAAGPMPSITLRGVGIKGTSSVQFQEAAAAAQAEAQSALNQDQVPRAYREAVKHYFDDLKK
jgi:hypothetical protein